MLGVMQQPVKNAKLELYQQLQLVKHMEVMEEKRAPKTVNLPPTTIAHGTQRAAQFRLTFSRYVEWLIEQDYDSGQTRIVIVAGPPAPEGQGK